MAARTMPPDVTYFLIPGYTNSLVPTEASRAGDVLAVYSDFAIWDTTANSYVDPAKVKNQFTGIIGLTQTF